MNSRQKGAAGEREWAKYLREKFGLTDARRGVQYSGSSDSPDCTGAWEGTHTEVKRVEKFDPYSWVEQAVRDAGSTLIPYVTHRQNGKQWLVTVRASDLKTFCQLVASGSTSNDLKPSSSPRTKSESDTSIHGSRDTATVTPLLSCVFNNSHRK